MRISDWSSDVCSSDLDRRNGMLVDELRMRIATQQHAEIIEPGDDPLQLDAIHQEDGDGHLCLAHIVEENVLQILAFVRRHQKPPFCCWGSRLEPCAPRRRYAPDFIALQPV